MTDKHPGGRPSKYEPEYAEQARKLAALGATDREIADFFGVHEATLYRWQQQYPELCEALKVGKEPADERVVRSLYRRAVGYSYDSEKIMQFQGAEVRIPYVEHVPPDTTAMIFWLKNRRPDLWRDRVINEHTGKDGGPIETVGMDVRNLSKEERAALKALLLKAKGNQETGDD